MGGGRAGISEEEGEEEGGKEKAGRGRRGGGEEPSTLTKTITISSQHMWAGREGDSVYDQSSQGQRLRKLTQAQRSSLKAPRTVHKPTNQCPRSTISKQEYTSLQSSEEISTIVNKSDRQFWQGDGSGEEG